MTTTPTQPLTFAQFIGQYPEDVGIYEFVDGEIIEIRAPRAHNNVARFIAKSFDREIDRLELDYIVEREATIGVITKTGHKRGRNPDVSVIDEAQ